MRRKLAKVGSLAGAILSEDSPDDRDSGTMLVSAAAIDSTEFNL